MRFVNAKVLVALGLGLCVCFVTACHHKIPHVKLSRAAAKQSRLDWNLKTLVGAYEEYGNTGDRWDEAATNALTIFAQSRVDEVDEDSWQNNIATNCDAALKAGCDDPMIRYLHLRFPMTQITAKEYADKLCKVEAEMQQSSYPPVRKFYLSLRALEQVYAAYPRNEIDRQLTGELANNLLENLVNMASDTNAPGEEIYQASDQGLKQLKGSKDWYERCYTQIEPALAANWPDDAVTWLLKGEAEIDRAWFARGGGYANTVKDEQWKGFEDHLAAAEESLNHAWKVDPQDERIARQMMVVELGKGGKREDMEVWFARAMAIKPDNYDACYSKLYYLEPKWYGSKEDMLEFGRECVQNTNWAGHVPLILLDAHRTIQHSYTDDTEKEDYWKKPDVWADLQAAFDRFFELNPTTTGWYYDYAWYAYHAEQWDKFNELVPKLGKVVDYSYFGGEEEFNKMVAMAKEHAKVK